MLMQLDPTLPVEVEGKGKGYAIMVIDYGENHNLVWVVIMNDTREIWCVQNQEIKAQSNWTMGRK